MAPAGIPETRDLENRAPDNAIEFEVPLTANQVPKPFKKLRKLLKKFPRRPSPSEVHDIRTRTRAIEATLSALRLDRKRSGKRLLKASTPIRKSAGKVRDMDVLTGFASTLAGDSDDKCLVELLEHLGRKRFTETRKLHKTVLRRRGAASQSLKRCSSAIKRRFRKNDDTLNWPTDAEATALRLSTELGDWPELKAQNLHPFRLKVKELRNVLKLSDKNEDEAMLQTLGEVKDSIGGWHDWTELAGIAEKVLDHGQNCEVRAQVHAETKRRFVEALRLSNHVRAQYFGQSQSKKNGRQSPSLKEPVLKASAKLAA